MSGLDVASYYANDEPVRAEITLSLPYQVWERLEKSRLWHDLVRRIDETERSDKWACG